MKKFLVLAMMLALVVPCYANKMINVDDKVEKMKSHLNLTQDQANQVRPIIQEFKDKMDQIHQEKEDKLNNVLTPNQMNQLRDKMEKDKNNWKE